MAFLKKIWTDRVSEHPSRRILTNIENNQVMTVDVTRAEGNVTTQGESFSSDTMNDLENRIATAFGNCDFSILSDGAYVNYTLNGVPVSKKLGEAQLSGTAVASNVLKGKTFYSTSSENKLTGSMVDYAGDTLSAGSFSISGGKVTMSIPNTGRYSTSSKLTGTISDYSGKTVTAKTTSQANGNVNLTLPYDGYYTSGSVVKTSEKNITRVKIFKHGSSSTTGEYSLDIGTGAKFIYMKLIGSESNGDFKNGFFAWNGSTWDYGGELKTGAQGGSDYNMPNKESDYYKPLPFYTNGILKCNSFNNDKAVLYKAVFDVIVGY